MLLLTTILVLSLVALQASNGFKLPPATTIISKSSKSKESTFNEYSPSVGVRNSSSRRVLPNNGNGNGNLGIPREEWLAKEYFTYLCAPEECIDERTKSELRNACYTKHSSLRAVISKCFDSNGLCNVIEDRSLLCSMEASRRNPTTIPLELHDCVDGLISLKTWKCIRRVQMEKVRSFMDDLRKRQELLGIDNGTNKKPRNWSKSRNDTRLYVDLRLDPPTL